MRTGRIKAWVFGWLLGSAGVFAAGSADYAITADLDGGTRVSVAHEGALDRGWSIDAEVEFSEPIPRMVVRGSLETRQPIEERSFLSYHVLDGAGETILKEGHRSSWSQTTGGSLKADFEIEIPEVLDRPDLLTVRIVFDAVVELEYWYRDQFPKISFPEIRITNLPKRDHYEPGWAWVPQYLPAGFETKIPASFSVGFRDPEVSRFVPALDVNTVDGATRIASQRIEMDASRQEGFFDWMPLDVHEAGTVMVRPGLVWENVRWYEASDWFERQAVTFISPIWYGALVWVGLIALWWSRGALGQIEHRGLSRIALVGWGLSAAWFSAHLLVSGFWLLAVFYTVVICCARVANDRPRLGTYCSSWAFFVFMELYWSRLQGTVSTAPAGVWLSVAVWSLLLLPLLAIRRAGIRHVVALGLTLIWTSATFAAVVYFEFFQDYPSIENLAYAGQVGELGDSVTSLIRGNHVLPFFVWASGVAIFAGMRNQRKTQIEKT